MGTLLFQCSHFCSGQGGNLPVGFWLGDPEGNDDRLCQPRVIAEASDLSLPPLQLL